jgi:hypothetical protein
VKEKNRAKSTTNKKKLKLLTIPNKLIMQSQTQLKIIIIKPSREEGTEPSK